MLLGDKKVGILCGNLEEMANDYQASTSAVRELERIEGWGVHTAVQMAPLKALRPLVIERRARRYFLQISNTKHTSICTVGFGAVKRALTGNQESWASFQPLCPIN